jgi:hypothetical protein
MPDQPSLHRDVLETPSTGSDHCAPSVSSLACLPVSSPSPAVSLSASREGFRAGEGLPDPACISPPALDCDENWHGNAIAFQDRRLQPPDLDVCAVDDPDDPIACDAEIGHIRWTAAGSHCGSVLDDHYDQFDACPRAQMDDAAQVTCTNDRTLLLQYREYGSAYPCPIRLWPAIGQEAILPEGEGLLFLPSRDPVKFYRFKTYYFPHLNGTLLSEGDLHTGLGFPAREYSGVSLHHHYLTGIWTAISHHKQAQAKNVEFHWVVGCGTKLSHPISHPSKAGDHSRFTSDTPAFVRCYDDASFLADCKMSKDIRNRMMRQLRIWKQTPMYSNNFRVINTLHILWMCYPFV